MQGITEQMALENAGTKIKRKHNEALKWLKICPYLKWMNDYKRINKMLVFSINQEIIH